MKKYLIKREEADSMSGYVRSINDAKTAPHDITSEIECAIDFKDENLAKNIAKFLSSNDYRNKKYKAVIVTEEEVE